MPQVPVYDQPQVGRQPLQGGEQRISADPSAFGAVQGQQLGQAGQALGQMADVVARIQERRDLDEAFRVETAVMSDYKTFEQNLQKTRRGENAKGVVDDVDKWWANSETTYGKDVSPRAKQLVAKSIARARAQAIGTMGSYQLSEEDRAQSESYIAVQGQEIQNAITTGDETKIAEAKNKISQATAKFGSLRGWSAAKVAEENTKWASTLHVQAINTLVDDKNNGPERAQAYFDANKSEIASGNQKQLEKIISGAVVERKALENANKMSGMPFDDAVEKARAIDDPEERKLTIAALKDNDTLDQVARRRREEKASDTVWQLIGNRASESQLPKAVLAQLDGKERAQVAAHYEAQRARLKTEAAGQSVKTDYAVYEAIMNMPKDELLGTKISRFQDKLARGDLEKLIDYQARMRQPEKEKDLVSFNNKVTGRMESLAIATGERNQEKRGAFRMEAQQSIEQHIARTGKPPSPKEEDEILDRLTVKQKGGWFGGDKRLFEVPAAERSKFVPEDAKGKALIADETERKEIDPYLGSIKAALTSQGLPATQENIVALYRKTKQAGRLNK